MLPLPSSLDATDLRTAAELTSAAQQAAQEASADGAACLELVAAPAVHAEVTGLSQTEVVAALCAGFALGAGPTLQVRSY